MLAMMLVVIMYSIGPQRQTKTWAEFKNLYNEGALDRSSVRLEETSITATMRDAAVPGGAKETVRVDFAPQARELNTKRVDELTGGNYKDTPGPSALVQFLISPLLWTLLIFGLIWFVISRGLRGAGGPGGMLGNFGKSRHKMLARESTGITFKDVAGIDDAKEEVRELVEFLKHPKKFMRLGGRIPRGVLLIGDPGCGKTLLAKAIAGEADVPFFSISGSDFVEMFVGVGASRVRDLFKQAKENSPCIIFLDEIDAVGRRRGGGFTTGGHDEREQTLNAILVEMDGFDSSDQVIVIAATNRSDVLDPALTRPGRFDRQVIVPLPDLKGRLEILNVHARKVKISPDVDLERIAKATPMFSGAELAALINEAAIIATMGEKEFVEHDDLEEARDKVKYGRSAKSRKIEEKERVATAFHEAGHAVLQMLLPDADPLHKVTIIPRGQALGATLSLPEKDRYGFSRKWLLATMRVLCGGRIAEERKTGDVSSGAAMDIQMLTGMARAMVLQWGMSERLGFVRLTGSDTREMYMPDREYSDETGRIIDEEIKSLSGAAYEDARRLLAEHWEKVDGVAQALLRHETLTADEVRRIMDGKPLAKPSVSELLEAEAKRKQPGIAPDAAPDDTKAGPATGGLSPSPA
ncbi:MAG: ATP-dependent zinc metalloprotease FtsH [Planctomycetes bacterium]|nr:ATP-dependent zinc metalloprotease FtsH [Planctomycetota bacterium]